MLFLYVLFEVIYGMVVVAFCMTAFMLAGIAVLLWGLLGLLTAPLREH